MSNELKIAIKFDLKELESKENIILEYQPLYKEVVQNLSDLYILGLIFENLESQGLIEIDKKEKKYFNKFRKYKTLVELEKSKDKFLSTINYFEELYQQVEKNLQHIEIEFVEEEKIENQYIKQSIQKWK